MEEKTKKAKKPTQKEMVLGHLLEHGFIEPDTAWTQYGCYRLGAVIFDLRKEGYNIETIDMDGVSKITGAPCKYARYVLHVTDVA